MKKILLTILFTLVLSGNAYAEKCKEGNCKNGYGTKIISPGIYTGSFKEGKPNGSGIFKFTKGRNKGDEYIGNFENGGMEGFGLYKFENGQKFIGEFKNDAPNGNGIYFWKNGNVYIGEFKNGIRYGQGRMIGSDPSLIINGIYDDLIKKKNNLEVPKLDNNVYEIAINNQIKIPEYLYEFFEYYPENKTQIAKAEPSQTQPESDSDIKFCVFIPNFSNTKHSEKQNWKTNGYKYRVIRLDNPYLKCVNVQFIIDKNYHDQLFYEYLLDTMELVDKQDFVTLRPVDHWRNKAEPSQTQIADNDAKELENERKKIAEEKRKIEEEKRKIAEAKKKQEEEDQKRKEANAKLYVIGSGTGFFVSSEGHVVSNDHVVGICRKVATKIEGKIINFNVINTDEVNDLGLIKGDYKSKNFLNIKSEGAEFGEDIVAFGYPLSDALSTSVKLTRGIVSSLSGPGNNYSEIQIDAAIQPGNSGGPVLNMEGQVVGVASSGLNKLYMLESSEYIPENVNFAVAATTLSNFLKANGVTISNASMNISNTKELAKIGRPATLQLFCMNTKAVHEELKKTKKHSDVLLEKVIELR